MIETVNTNPDVNVQVAEYQRLLGYPRSWELQGRARELADEARAWYAKHGRPWVFTRPAKDLRITADSIVIDGARFSCRPLQHTLERAEAHNVVLVAVGAGPELEQRAQELWREEKPDEYYFLEVLGSAVVEHLTATTGAKLCSAAESDGMAVLPHYSPGYPEWEVAEQSRLLSLVRQNLTHQLPGELEVLDSGMLRPKKSLLAVFGVTRHTEHVRRLTELVPCENCSIAECQYRRVPYVGAPEYSFPEALSQSTVPALPNRRSTKRLDTGAHYSVKPSALARWTANRLSLEANDDGTTDALFRYDGTTCTDLGRPLVFHYHVRLGTQAEGYPIQEQRCYPASGDEGHTYMCAYLTDPDSLMFAIDSEKPLLGRRLNEVLAWEGPTSCAGCYCEQKSRMHKWGLVLETIHYALVQRDQISNGQAQVMET